MFQLLKFVATGISTLIVVIIHKVIYSKYQLFGYILGITIFCSFSPSPPLPTLWQKPALPFSLGVSFELTEHQEPVYQEHHAHQHHEHHDYPDYHDQHYPQHRYKPGICPEPDRDYYNRPGFYDSGGYNFPRG